MSVNITFEAAFIILLVLVNGFFAMSEIAIISARKVRLQRRADQGDRKARQALDLAESPGEFLATIQIGITLVGVLAGAFGGATIAAQISRALNDVPWLAPYSDVIGIGIVVLLITYLSLVLGELVPKRLALTHPEGIAAKVAGFMAKLSRLLSPAVGLLNVSSNLVFKLLRIKPSLEPPVTEEEINVMLKQGALTGVFEVAEQSMVAGVFRLGGRKVESLITPRTEIVWLDLEDPFDVNRQKIIESGFSRFPVAQGSLDNVQGIVQSKDLLVGYLSGEKPDIHTAIVEPLFIPESSPALEALERLKTSIVPMALVIDEYGGVLGLVTINDMVESIVGEILESGKPEEAIVVQRPDGAWLVDGMLPLDEFKEIFQIRSIPDEERLGYKTVSGFVMAQLGRIPATTDRFEFGEWRIEVVDMDGFRVDKVELSRKVSFKDNEVAQGSTEQE